MLKHITSGCLILLVSICTACAQTPLNITTAHKPVTTKETAVMNKIPLDLENKQVQLNNGDVMPIIGLGTYSLLGETCINAVANALKLGYRKIDTAFMYHNEKEVGEGIRKSGVPRREIFVATKLCPSQFAEPEKAIEEALAKLNIDYIDLILLHHPGVNDIKAYKAMEKYVKAGKICL